MIPKEYFQEITFSWKRPSDTPSFDYYIMAEYEFTSMGGPHYGVGRFKEVNRKSYFLELKESDDVIEWKYVNRWVYLEDIVRGA